MPGFTPTNITSRSSPRASASLLTTPLGLPGAGRPRGVFAVGLGPLERWTVGLRGAGLVKAAAFVAGLATLGLANTGLWVSFPWEAREDDRVRRFPGEGSGSESALRFRRDDMDSMLAAAVGSWAKARTVRVNSGLGKAASEMLESERGVAMVRMGQCGNRERSVP
jgi:hypothetical protein